MSTAVERLIAAVAAGEADGMFPPVAEPGPDGVLMLSRYPGGPQDAEHLAELLRRPRLDPLVRMLSDLDEWCEARALEYDDAILAPGVLRASNAALFGPLVTEVFTACVLGESADLAEYAATRLEQQQRMLDEFLDRLSRDRLSAWPTDLRFGGGVEELALAGDETHNGGKRVLRVTMRGGGRLAYKPRPVAGEVLFLATSGSHQASSVFRMLNRLPPVSGDVTLPIMAAWRGKGSDRNEYSWQEWIEPPHQWATIRTSGEYGLAATRLTATEARKFWNRAGSLAGAAFAFGIADLMAGNVLAGRRAATDPPMFYPVDLEVCFTDTARLADTGLLAGPDTGHHHGGIEDEARWCALEGPRAVFHTGRDGSLDLRVRQQPWGRTESRNVVTDKQNRVGYAGHLTNFLRGMFDVWTLLSAYRDTVERFLMRHVDGEAMRVVRKPTAEYVRELERRLRGAAPESGDFQADELEQLRRWDVPYFVHRAPTSPDPADLEEPPRWSDRTRNFDMTSLGVAIRDAVEHVRARLTTEYLSDERHGVQVFLADTDIGQVSFDWPRRRQRMTYSWDAHTTRLRVRDLAEEPDQLPRVRDRLLRIDDIDSRLRAPWADGGFTDASLEDKLLRLTTSAMDWLENVVDHYGWPTAALVGADASNAACRLLQHATGPSDFQYRCLALLRRAADDGLAPGHQVAFLTDTLRVNSDRPQLYGTKFYEKDGRLEPLPIEEPDTVDDRRRRMGMPSLSAYTTAMRRRFPLPTLER
ncbi:DUF4135 domain-containing protein [Stackebrandtia nassauensis]|uniref:Lantibiotic biosynthesis protein dehydration domain-containing protein n=1 Tax=Stackebrandtia nassauensis (strain DSM 44728 / CIP 108903 / NRRL B-16338 / NBRC 102104 / LLR-40K-21) TaxID=446470 RepID=D3PUN9_STANL|nr:DUF4135 domain-containing protein [Stackebrandtia nassauensis]ADD43052.1 hypothetical protein Snas_3388 [Stackebrandtia nassauensis DSM 44728]